MITKHRPKHVNQTKNPYFVTGRTYFGLPYFDTDEKKELALLSAINLACKNYHLALDSWTILDNHYHLLFRPPGCNWNVGIADKSATSEDGEVARLRAIENFRIGKVVGSIHGKSSSLLKEIADKSATSRSSAFTRDNPYESWWDIKYWEEIKRRNISLYGKRSQLAEKKRAEEFERLLKEIADKSATSRSSNFSCDSERNSELARANQKLIDFIKKINRIWYQYTDHVIRDERDYWMHLNYIHQNCVKHDYAENMWDYRFSSIHQYDKDWIADCFRNYPIADFEPEMESFD